MHSQPIGVMVIGIFNDQVPIYDGCLLKPAYMHQNGCRLGSGVEHIEMV